MIRALIAYLARLVRQATYGGISPAELAAKRQAAFDRYSERTRLAGVALHRHQQVVVDEVNARIEQAQALAVYAARQLDDLADNGVLDGSTHTPAMARSQAAVLRKSVV